MEIGDYYTASFYSLKKNLNMMIPSVIGTAISFIVVLIAIIWIIFGFIGPELSNTNFVSSYGHGFPFTATQILNFAVVGIITLIILSFINSFVSAATIGMAKKVIKKETPELDIAWKNVKKYFFRVFIVSIIMMIAFLLLSTPLFVGLSLLLSNPNVAIALMLVGILIIVIGGILLMLSLMVVYQSIVMSKKSIVESIKDSYEIFWGNKLRVFLVFLIGLAIAVGLGMILSLIPLIGPLLNIIANIVLVPYFILVTSNLYIDLKGI